MIKMQFTVEIKASKEKVWETLWGDSTFRDWADIIDEGMYMDGVLEEGSEVQFISSVSGYGVTSLVERLDPNLFVLFRHRVDTKERGVQQRESEWTGGMESYSLVEKKSVTVLTAELDVPLGQAEIFKSRLPKALARVKVLSEK